MAKQRARHPTLALRSELEEISRLPLAELRMRWLDATGRPTPKLSAKMLRLALGYELQAKTLGGLPRKTLRVLDGKGNAAAALAPGTRLVREWGGKVHIVTVAEDGSIQWNGKNWRSLSQVARAISGTRWSGPAFFGLQKHRSLA